MQTNAGKVLAGEAGPRTSACSQPAWFHSWSRYTTLLCNFFFFFFYLQGSSHWQKFSGGFLVFVPLEMYASPGTACLLKSHMLTVRCLCCRSSPALPRGNYMVHFGAFCKEVASPPLSSTRHLSRSSPNENSEPWKDFLHPPGERVGGSLEASPQLTCQGILCLQQSLALLTEEIRPESQKLIHLTHSPLSIVGLSTSPLSPHSNLAHAHSRHLFIWLKCSSR